MHAHGEVFIVGYARTPIGVLNGTLAGLTAPQLGAAAVKEALARARVPASAVEAVFMGNVLTGNVGQAPARQVRCRCVQPLRCVVLVSAATAFSHTHRSARSPLASQSHASARR